MRRDRSGEGTVLWISEGRAFQAETTISVKTWTWTVFDTLAPELTSL